MRSVKFLAIMVVALGVCSSLAGLMAENKKPAHGSPRREHGYMICEYGLSDPSILWGTLSVALLAVSAFLGLFSLLVVKGAKVPCGQFFANSSFHCFFALAVLTTGAAAALLVWPTLTELFHRNHNKHYNLYNECATAKTGLFGGGAFVSFDASLMWLASLMLACNIRDDYFETQRENIGGKERKDEGEYEAIADDA